MLIVQIRFVVSSVLTAKYRRNRFDLTIVLPGRGGVSILEKSVSKKGMFGALHGLLVAPVSGIIDGWNAWCTRLRCMIPKLPHVI